MKPCRKLLLLGAFLGASLTGCKDKLPPAPAPAGGAKAVAPSPAPAGPAFHQLRSLTAEAARAELDAGGVLADLGSPDQHKYTRGGWYSGWGRSGEDGAVTYLEAGARAVLTFHLWKKGVTALVLRGRSTRGQAKVKVYIRGKAVGEMVVPKKWKTVALYLDKPLAWGRHLVRFERIATGAPPDQGLLLDWVWLKRGPGSPPPLAKTATRDHGDPRRVLVGDAPRTLSYYLDLPRRASLAFSYAARTPTTFQVKIAEDGSPPRRLFSAVGGKRWTKARVDLSSFGGRLVRLDLITSRSGGGISKEASWGGPAIVRIGPRPRLPALSGHKRPRNVIHVLVDAARQDAYRPFNPHSRTETPGLSRLAARSLRFQNAYTNANWTLPSVVSILSGRYPHAFALEGQLKRVPASAPLLPEHLQRHGFATAAFAANVFVSEPFGLHRGWDRLYNPATEHNTPDGTLLFQGALKWLRKERDADKPFYLYIHAMEPHGPYRFHHGITDRLVSPPYRGGLGERFENNRVEQVKAGKLDLPPEDRRYVRHLYDGEVAYHDQLMGRFLAEVEKMGLLKRTLVIFSNDHGEEMWDRGRLGHGHSFREELVRSPLLLSYPPLFKAGSKVQRPVELVDLAPTILDLLGVPPMAGMHGVSLRGVIHGAHAWHPVVIPGPRWTIRFGAYKLEQRAGEERLHDLVKDPGEKRDLARSAFVARRACEVYLGEAMATPTKSARLSSVKSYQPVSGGDVKLDSKLRRKLEALGYIQ